MQTTETFEQWAERGRALLIQRNRNMWQIGDWLNDGERKWGEMYAQAHDDLLISYQTLANYAWVARAYEPETAERELVDVLSFSHFKIALGVSDRSIRLDALLRAFTFKMNCADFQMYVNELKGKPETNSLPIEKIARQYTGRVMSVDHAASTITVKLDRAALLETVDASDVIVLFN